MHTVHFHSAGWMFRLKYRRDSFQLLEILDKDPSVLMGASFPIFCEQSPFT